MAKGSSIPVRGGQWLKLKDYADAAGIMIGHKRAEVARVRVYKGDSGAPMSDNKNWQNVARLICDVHVFRSHTAVESGIPDEVLHDVQIDNNGVASRFATLEFQDAPGRFDQNGNVAREPSRVTMRPGLALTISDPGNFKQDRGWDFVPMSRDVKGYPALLQYRNDAPDVAEGPAVEEPAADPFNQPGLGVEEDIVAPF